jgi:predicted Zn-dependent protease
MNRFIQIFLFSLLLLGDGFFYASAQENFCPLPPAPDWVSEVQPEVPAEYTPIDEYYLGRAVAATILTRYSPWLLKPGLTVYLNSICAAVAINSPAPNLYNGYHIMILDSPELNAFSTSGGHIFLSRGLVETLDSEDALAAIIAHEIAHIQLKHSVEVLNSLKRTKALSIMDQLAGNGSIAEDCGGSLWDIGSLFDKSVWEIAHTMLVNGFSQAQEFAADTYALSLLAATGYDPSALVDVLHILEKDFSPAGFHQTHPPAAIRIANLQGPLENYRIPDTRSFRTARYQFWFNK